MRLVICVLGKQQSDRKLEKEVEQNIRNLTFYASSFLFCFGLVCVFVRCLDNFSKIGMSLDENPSAVEKLNVSEPLLPVLEKLGRTKL